jgi:hypothetical protein
VSQILSVSVGISTSTAEGFQTLSGATQKKTREFSYIAGYLRVPVFGIVNASSLFNAMSSKRQEQIHV